MSVADPEQKQSFPANETDLLYDITRGNLGGSPRFITISTSFQQPKTFLYLDLQCFLTFQKHHYCFSSHRLFDAHVNFFIQIDIDLVIESERSRG